MFSANEDFDDKVVMMEEHDRLNKSLAALTRHFAHVQLRLQQVVSAPTADDREVKIETNEKIKLIICSSGVTL